MNIELSRIDSPNGTAVFSQLPLVVGSSLHADLCVHDAAVDPCHCMIDQVNGTLIVSDLVSRNGTRVNGRRVDESLLLPADELTVGTTSFSVHYRRTANCPVTSKQTY